MKKQLFILFILFICGNVFAHDQNRKFFNSGWKFALHEHEGAEAPGYDDSNWDEVILPHDASVGGKFDKENSTGANGWLPFQEGWYRKTFTITEDEQGKKVFIDFDGVYRDSKVWINGEYLGRNLNGYLGFEYDLTPYIKSGEENVIAVHYDNRVNNTSRWYTGEGIYRDVWLKIVNPVYVAYNGTYVTTPVVTDKLAKVTVETEVINESGEPGSIEIETALINPAGETVTTRKAVVYLKYFKTYTFHQEFKVKNPELWDTENPNLYYAKTTVHFNGEPQDEYLTRFGIRDIELTPEHGLLLNGKKVFAQGGDIHHDLGCVGTAALESGYRYRLQLLKDMGCNSLRLSHNPHAPVLLDVCDEMGILVISEAYDKWTSQYNGGEKSFKDTWKEDMERFLKRDRNHPSIYLWSVGNEVLKQGGNIDEKFETKEDAADMGAGYLKFLAEFVHKFEPTRKVTAALFPSRQNSVVEWDNWDNHKEFMKTMPPAMAFHMDVVSWNYTENFFDIDHKNYPQMMFLASETGTNLDFGNRINSMLEFDKEHVIGHYYWTALSYLGESDWPRKSWQRAFFDIDEEKTPIGYIYESLYKDEPVLKIMVKEPDTAKYNRWDRSFSNKRWSWYPMLDHWNFEEGLNVEVQAFTNCDEVELLINNSSLGSKRIEEGAEPVLYWGVPYQEGKLIAIGKRNGKVVAEDTLVTAGEAVSLNLSADKQEMKADGADLVYVQVSFRDKDGNVVPVDKLLNFEVKGPATIAGTANSDIFTDESWQGDKRTAINGKCLVVLRSTYDGGTVELIAKGSELESAPLEISSGK